MTLATFCFVGISLFMIHEFEEIIFVRAFLNSRKGKNSRTLWARGERFYPSTATLALEIAEEFLLVFAFLLFAILLNLPWLAIGALLANSLHLVAHIFDSIRAKMLSPGTLTSIITLPILIFVSVIFVAQNRFNSWLILPGFLISAVIFALNLSLIHKLALRIEKYLDKAYK